MTLLNPAASGRPRPRARETLGRVLAVSGAQITVGLIPPRPAARHAPRSENSRHRQRRHRHRRLDHRDLRAAAARPGCQLPQHRADRPRRRDQGECRRRRHFQRGITEYPMIGEPAMLMSDRELRLIYNGINTKPSNIGVLQQDTTIPAQIRASSISSASTSPSSARPASANRTASPFCSSKSWTSGRTSASS